MNYKCSLIIVFFVISFPTVSSADLDKTPSSSLSFKTSHSNSVNMPQSIKKIMKKTASKKALFSSSQSKLAVSLAKIQLDAVLKLQASDRFIITIDDDKSTFVIDKKVDVDGRHSYVSGYLETNKVHKFMLTIENNAAFGHLSLERGNFQVEVYGDSAWLIPEAILEKRVNKNIPDYLIHNSPIK